MLPSIDQSVHHLNRVFDVHLMDSYNPSFLLLAMIKDIYFCPIEIIKGLTGNGQFQLLTKLKGPQEGTYLYTTQFLSLR